MATTKKQLSDKEYSDQVDKALGIMGNPDLSEDEIKKQLAELDPEAVLAASDELLLIIAPPSEKAGQEPAPKTKAKP